MFNYTVWIPALWGGLAGAILTLLAQISFRWWNRPILVAIFKSSEPGCIVETPAQIVQSGQAIGKSLQRYIRLKVKNGGKSFAKNVSVCVTKITYNAPGSGTADFAEEVFDFKLSLTPDRAVFNLAAGGHRFIDIVRASVNSPLDGGPQLPPHCLPQVNCTARLDFDFVFSPARLEEMGWTRGTYQMEVFVSAENAASLSTQLSWSWDGTLNNLQIATP